MEPKLKHYLIFIGMLALTIIAISLLSAPSEARLCVWDGESSSPLASNATNWDNDLAPVANDSILFDGLNATADDPCTWDLATDSFGTFTIGAGYTGTITQSSDIYISGYSQAGGTFTGVTTKWVYCDGDFVRTAGIIINDKIKLNISNADIKIGTGTLYVFNPHGIVNILDNLYSYSYDIPADTVVNVNNKNVYVTFNVGSYFKNYGYINGTGTIWYLFWSTVSSSDIHDIGTMQLDLKFRQQNGGGNNNLHITGNIICNSITVYSDHATYTCTLDLNGHNLTATSITVGTRGILQCGEGTITCTNITSTAGTIIPETATWIFTGHGTITCAAGQQFYICHMDLPITITNTINCTHDARIINIPSIYYAGIDIYKNGIYNHTGIPTETYYSAGPKLLTGGSYTYLPDIIITLGPWLEDLNFTRKASITTNLPVTYNITGTAADWLIINEGMISGIPPAPGTYTYTITATHSSGSMDVESGVLVISSDSLSVIAWNDSIAAGVVLGLLITTISFLGYWKQIPILQLIAVAVLIFSLVIFLRIGHFAPFLLLFILVNMVLFVLGMIRYYQGR